MTKIDGCTALITGGASGIGLLVGRLLLEQGARHLIIWDVSDQAIQRAVTELTSSGHRVDGFQVDVTHLAQVRAALQQMREQGIRIDLLVNNAGVIVGKTFVDHLPEEIQRTVAVNTLAPMQLARELLPAMLERRAGHIVNISSAAALVSKYVAREIVSAIRKDRVFLHLPKWFRLVRLLQGLLPTRWFDRAAGEWFGIYHSMSTFTGRAR